MLVLFCETFRSHGRVWKPPDDENPPEDREAAVGDEDCLPGLESVVAGNERETVGEETADDLLPGRRIRFALVNCGRKKGEEMDI